MKKIVYLLIAITALSLTSQAQNDTMYIMKAGQKNAKYHVTNQVDSIIFYKPTNYFNSQAQNDTMYIMKAGQVTAKYHVTNQLDSIIFYKPTNSNSVTDASGNTYPTVKIGTQTWMAENLRSTKYSDGTNIPLVTDQTQWANNSTNNTKLPMMSWYNNDQATYTANKYGALYNWYAVSPTSNGNKNVCPTGWHVPTDAEWTTLTDYLGGSFVAGGKMKSTGTQYWNSPNARATNESGFSGLPGGTRRYDGSFVQIGDKGYWWSSTEDDTSNAWPRNMNYEIHHVGRGYHVLKQNGFSVRCLRD